MAMGMTPAQFWDEPPLLAVFYRKAFRLEQQIKNEQAWLAGLYVYDAFAVCMANAFGKRGAKKYNYIEKPIDIFPPTEREKKLREKQEYAKMQQAMESMRQMQQRSKKQKGD